MGDDRTRRAPPRYPASWFALAGALREAAADPLGLMARLAATGEPVVAARLGPLRGWGVFDADLARQVLVTDEESYGRPAFVARAFDQAMGPNLFTASGRAWSGRRRLFQPRFSRAHVDGLVETMATTIADEVDGWPAGTTFDVQARLTDLTLRVAALTLIGLDVDRHELGPELRRHFAGVVGWIGHRFFHPFSPPALVPTPRNRRMARDRAALEAIVGDLVARRRRSPDRPADVLQLLVEATDDDGRPLGDDEIVKECVGFLFAGHETTASTLTWALYLLATTPGAQERVAAEADRLLAATPGAQERVVAEGDRLLAATPGAQERVAAEGDRLLAAGYPTPEALDSLDYTARVIEETMRLYPPGIGIARVARRDTSLGGYPLRRGTLVYLALWAIHRDPRHWPDPERFDPDRFSAAGDAAAHHALLPFGLGPRQCLGARFARTEARLALATIASRWRIDLSAPVDPKPRIELAPRVEGGLPVRLHRRTTAPSIA